MDPLLLDTAFMIALVFDADQSHGRAQETWNEITGQRRLFVTTSFVLDEIVTFLNSRGEHELAVDAGKQLLGSPTIEMVDVERSCLDEAWRYFVRHDDKRYSLTASRSS